MLNDDTLGIRSLAVNAAKRIYQNGDSLLFMDKYGSLRCLPVKSSSYRTLLDKHAPELIGLFTKPPGKAGVKAPSSRAAFTKRIRKAIELHCKAMYGGRNHHVGL